MDPSPAPPRLRSLDVLRGFIIFSMLFVNDVSGVHGTPGWLKHAPLRADGMTVVDLVFPAFLFMVGMALPFALGRRLAKGESPWRIWSHIGLRTVSLVLLGLFMVIEEAVQPGGPLAPTLWTLAGYVGVVLVWSTYGAWQAEHPWRIRCLRLTGAAVLVTVLGLYRGPSGSGFMALRPGWWGILGLIGWAYLAACAVYVPGRRQLESLLGGLALFVLLTLAALANVGGHSPWLLQMTQAFAPHGALVLAGAMLGSILQPRSAHSTVKARVVWTLWFAAGLYAASLLLTSLAPLHEMFTVSKLLGTPAWCLRSAAFSALLWLAIYLVVDVWGQNRGTSFFAEAGGNALFAYILAPVSMALWDLVLGRFITYDALGATWVLGLSRALGSAFLLTWLAGFLNRRGLTLKL